MTDSTPLVERLREVANDRRYSDEFVGNFLRSNIAALDASGNDELVRVLRDARSLLAGAIEGCDVSHCEPFLRTIDAAIAPTQEPESRL